jgi:3'-phosphoadenosine 5'-phosphosulfate sulfotransferase (PAPS reductase)/FAD synthetase
MSDARRHVISVSGGKDSTAMLTLALARCPRESVIPIFCDTGNEHAIVYEYLDYLEQALDIKIVRLKADFTEEVINKRMFIARDTRARREYDTAPVFDTAGNPVPKRDKRGSIITRKVKRDGVEVIEAVQKTRKVGGGRRVRWTNKAKRRALEVLHPTGNPYLDLCMWKGRFPSRLAQFCTEELKRNMAVSFQLDLIDAGHSVISWQGVRRDESINRRDAQKIGRIKHLGRIAPRLWVFRPLVDWTAAQVFTQHFRAGIKPNPLYMQGMTRVGCMPCINCGKDQIREIAARFPEALAEKERWEQLVGKVAKRGFSTFFNKELHTDKSDRRHVYESNRMMAIIEWARTSRGGRQYDLLADLIEPESCASVYGLCE